MTELSKEDKRNMKKFNLNNKTDFIVYLQELIGRTYKCIRKHKRYLEKLSKYIINIVDENSNVDTKEIKVREEVYGEFLDLLSNVESYVLNLIGDHQQSSISYIKFRDIISKKKKKGTIDFEIKDLDETANEYLNELNKMRNWANHVPESLLTSEIKLIQEGKLEGHSRNPIKINIPNYYSLEYLIDLYLESKAFNEVIIQVHQRMKKDYSCLIGESMRIEINYIDKPVELNRLDAAKMSAQIQELKGLFDEKDK